MPKGVYQRKDGLKRKFSAEALEKFRQNLVKARAAIKDNAEIQERVKAIRAKNALKAPAVRVARAILKHCPLGASAGTEFYFAFKTKTYRIIDPIPRKVSENRWEQLFLEIVTQKIGGVLKTFSGKIAVVWDYEPNLENMMKHPVLEPRE